MNDGPIIDLSGPSLSKVLECTGRAARDVVAELEAHSVAPTVLAKVTAAADAIRDRQRYTYDELDRLHNAAADEARAVHPNLAGHVLAVVYLLQVALVIHPDRPPRPDPKIARGGAVFSLLQAAQVTGRPVLHYVGEALDLDERTIEDASGLFDSWHGTWAELLDYVRDVADG